MWPQLDPQTGLLQDDKVTKTADMKDKVPIGIVGLGIMGSAIARNLTRAGWRVSGFDVDRARAAAVANDGVTAAGSVTDVARTCPVVLTSLPSAAALDAVVSDIGAANPPAGLIIAELSTLSIPDKDRARERLASFGAVLLDCPISGTGAQAVTGDLVIFASGPREAVARCEPAFAAFAKSNPYVGDFGSGMKFKLIANLLVAIHNVSTAEALSLGRRAGLDPELLIKVVGAGAGGSRMLDVRGPLMAKGAFEPATMKLDVWQKDMDLIASFATALGAATPLFDATKPLYAEANRRGWGARDTAAVHDILSGRGK
jgi:3-hydroxyisobutyrate dehydrogenase-like beta-hydroxyacid dehydrogenase